MRKKKIGVIKLLWDKTCLEELFSTRRKGFEGTSRSRDELASGSRDLGVIKVDELGGLQVLKANQRDGDRGQEALKRPK